jgi:hypothetical protein
MDYFTQMRGVSPSITNIIHLSITKSDIKYAMVPSGKKIRKQQLNVLAYADDIVLTGKNEIEIRHLFVEIEDIARKLGLQKNQKKKTKYIIVKQENSSKLNSIGQLTIKNYTFGRVENFKYLGVILNEDNSHQIDLQQRIKNANKTYFVEYFLLGVTPVSDYTQKKILYINNTAKVLKPKNIL